MKRSHIVRAAVVAAAAVASVAALNIVRARRTERRNPPRGRFVNVGGTRLHFLDEGAGPPVVLLHGNAVTATDWKSSGVMDALSARHRVIAFDRPGFGYSSRPRSHIWDAAAQAALLHEALRRLDVGPAVIVGHSWGRLVALALALEHPEDCKRLLLISGYYFPSVRLDAAIFGATALPVAGDLVRYTVSPLLGTLLGPMMTAKVFAPSEADSAFTEQLAMALRPWQMRANAEEAALMVPSASAMRQRYHELTVPTAIIAGNGDRIVDVEQSLRLAEQLPESQLLLVDGAGHMAHYTAADTVAETIGVMAEAG